MDVRVFDNHHKRGRKQHKLRVIQRSNNNKEVIGISLPSEKVGHLLGAFFTTSISGSSIILESGAKL